MLISMIDTAVLFPSVQNDIQIVGLVTSQRSPAPPLVYWAIKCETVDVHSPTSPFERHMCIYFGCFFGRSTESTAMFSFEAFHFFTRIGIPF